MEEQVKQLQEQNQKLQKQLEDVTAKMKGFSDSQEKFNEASQFIEDASILVGAIMKDTALKDHVKASIAGQPTPPADSEGGKDNSKNWKFDPLTGKPIDEATPSAPPKDERVDSLDGERRLGIIDEVESRFKYSSLKPEEKAVIRKSVGAWLQNYNMQVATVPIDRLKDVLTDAYLHVGLENANKEGKTNDVVASYFEDPGKLPSMGSGNTETQDTQLSPTQKKWAGKLNVSEDKVAEGLKQLTETGTISYKPKESQDNSKKEPVPSGQPTPPTPDGSASN